MQIWRKIQMTNKVQIPNRERPRGAEYQLENQTELEVQYQTVPNSQNQCRRTAKREKRPKREMWDCALHSFLTPKMLTR